MPGGTARPEAVISLVSRLLLAQAGVSAAIAVAYSSRSTGWLVFALVAALGTCGLAGLVRSASHSAWIVTLGFEVIYVVIGLLRFGYSSYLGGTLLGIITVGTLLRPSVARVFAPQPAKQGPGEPSATPSLPF